MRPSHSTEHRGPALLVPQTSFLGDVVLTTPLLTALRERLAPRRLAVLVRPEAAALLQGHPAVDDVLVDDKRGTDGGVAGLWRVARRLRREGFDLAVCPHRSLRTALLLALAGVPRRIGFDSSRGWFLFHERVSRDPRRHDVARNLALMDAVGGWRGTPCLHVPVAEAAAARAAALLDGHGGRPLAVLAPGSVWHTKRWTTAGFAALARGLGERGVSCVLVGAPADAERARRIAAAAGASVLDLTGRTDLATLTAVIDRSQVLVGNDSAPMHLATARGVPVVAVFCATTPALGYGPYGAETRVVEADLACRPCGRHGGRHCPRGTEDCRHLVRPGAVLEATLALLDARAGG
jgi:heptosyltransferase-2